MKERFLTVLKWFFIVLGIIFFIQLLLILGAFIGIITFANSTFKMPENINKMKDIKPIINYVQDYQKENGKYPETIENIKLKKDLTYKYEPSKDFNCYTVTLKSKKENLTKQYQQCMVKTDNSTSSSESYVEFSN